MIQDSTNTYYKTLAILKMSTKTNHLNMMLTNHLEHIINPFLSDPNLKYRTTPDSTRPTAIYKWT